MVAVGTFQRQPDPRNELLGVGIHDRDQRDRRAEGERCQLGDRVQRTAQGWIHHIERFDQRDTFKILAAVEHPVRPVIRNTQVLSCRRCRAGVKCSLQG